MWMEYLHNEQYTTFLMCRNMYLAIAQNKQHIRAAALLHQLSQATKFFFGAENVSLSINPFDICINNVCIELMHQLVSLTISLYFTMNVCNVHRLKSTYMKWTLPRWWQQIEHVLMANQMMSCCCCFFFLLSNFTLFQQNFSKNVQLLFIFVHRKRCRIYFAAFFCSLLMNSLLFYNC